MSKQVRERAAVTPQLNGGGEHAFTKAEYGPGGSQVDTTRPFTVHAYFGGSGSQLSSLEVAIVGESGGAIEYTAADAGYLMPREGAQACGLPLGRPLLRGAS